jgi:hypothetical protein
VQEFRESSVYDLCMLREKLWKANEIVPNKDSTDRNIIDGYIDVLVREVFM